MSRFPGFDVASSESEKQSLLSRYAFESMYPVSKAEHQSGQLGANTFFLKVFV